MLSTRSAGCVSTNLRQAESRLKLKLMSCSASQRDTKSFQCTSAADEQAMSSDTLSASQPSADDSLLSLTRLDTSALRRRLSDLEFNSTSEPANMQRHAKSASDIVLSRNCSADDVQASYSPPKPKVQKLRRRKQEFDQLLQTPPFDRRNVARRTGMERQMSEADSGFVSCESGTSAMESELKWSVEDSRVHSRTPPLQIRVRSPLVEAEEVVERGRPVAGVDDNAEDDINQMLFTPFKIGSGGCELPELSPDIELSTSIVAGSDSWMLFTPMSAGSRLRTSTPCRLLNSSPENESTHVISRADSPVSSLLREFGDEASCAFDDVAGHESLPLGCLPPRDGYSLREAIELDVMGLTFR